MGDQIFDKNTLKMQFWIQGLKLNLYLVICAEKRIKGTSNLIFTFKEYHPSPLSWLYNEEDILVYSLSWIYKYL